jgi:hypothetical protein
MLAKTLFTLEEIPLRFEGSEEKMDWYTILIPGKETTFLVKRGSSKKAVLARARESLARYPL